MLEILSRCGGPTGIRKAGRRRLAQNATKHALRMGKKLIDAILAALDEQTVTVPGSTAAVLPRLADNLEAVLLQRKQVARILAANAALICLARRPCDVLFAMLRNKTYYYRPVTA